MIAHPRLAIANGGHSAVAMPYAERSFGNHNRLDGALLNAWGQASAYLPSGFERARLKRLVRLADDLEKDLIGRGGQESARKRATT